jgi:hypothetical protein
VDGGRTRHRHPCPSIREYDEIVALRDPVAILPPPHERHDRRAMPSQFDRSPPIVTSLSAISNGSDNVVASLNGDRWCGLGEIPHVLGDLPAKRAFLLPVLNLLLSQQTPGVCPGV